MDRQRGREKRGEAEKLPKCLKEQELESTFSLQFATQAEALITAFQRLRLNCLERRKVPWE